MANAGCTTEWNDEHCIFRQVTEAALEIEGQAFQEMMESADAMEGIQAFFEKREPRFTHR